MSIQRKLNLVLPAVEPVLDPGFRPAVLANRAYRENLRQSGGGVPVEIALERNENSVSRFRTEVYPEDRPEADQNFDYLERLVKFLLWSRGGGRIHYAGPPALGERLAAYYRENPNGQFDASIMGGRIYDVPFEVRLVDSADDLPAEREATAPLGRHLEGCRIGFDLGASDRKVAALRDGETLFSEEVPWDPRPQSDPEWHRREIMESLKRAAEYLPRIDAIGGSSAGVFVNNRVKVASLFRGVPAELFSSRVKDLFLEIQKEWGGIPFEVVNDGEVTALAGAMSLEANAVLGVAMGSSEAAGYVNPDGNITSWLNELAFAPIDYNPDGPVDEWSGDTGCGVQYFSQQGVGRLAARAGIDVEANTPLPEVLLQVQERVAGGDPRAARIFETIGVCFGYGIAHYAEFYDFRNLLILGRVTSGRGGELILSEARRVLETEFPDLAARIAFHIPDEKQKRHGQAMAAASLPALK